LRQFVLFSTICWSGLGFDSAPIFTLGSLAWRVRSQALDRPLYNPPVPFVYILRCADGSLYTGIAKDFERRLAQHRAGRASRYSRARLPVRLVWSREVRSWSLALREEIRIKGMRKAEKEALLLLEIQDSCPPLSS
jgi:putative endonuclease